MIDASVMHSQCSPSNALLIGTCRRSTTTFSGQTSPTWQFPGSSTCVSLNELNVHHWRTLKSNLIMRTKYVETRIKGLRSTFTTTGTGDMWSLIWRLTAFCALMRPIRTAAQHAISRRFRITNLNTDNRSVSTGWTTPRGPAEWKYEKERTGYIAYRYVASSCWGRSSRKFPLKLHSCIGCGKGNNDIKNHAAGEALRTKSIRCAQSNDGLEIDTNIFLQRRSKTYIRSSQDTKHIPETIYDIPQKRIDLEIQRGTIHWIGWSRGETRGRTYTEGCPDSLLTFYAWHPGKISEMLNSVLRAF